MAFDMIGKAAVQSFRNKITCGEPRLLPSPISQVRPCLNKERDENHSSPRTLIIEFTK
jgi:hypothetical protein